MVPLPADYPWILSVGAYTIKSINHKYINKFMNSGIYSFLSNHFCTFSSGDIHVILAKFNLFHPVLTNNSTNFGMCELQTNVSLSLLLLVLIDTGDCGLR